MEILIRSVDPASYEPLDVDALSCTVIADDHSELHDALDAYAINREHFRAVEQMHSHSGEAVIAHLAVKPLVITAFINERWNFDFEAATQIIASAEAAKCESLCMMHFVKDDVEFPIGMYEHFLRAAVQASGQEFLKKIVVDVNEYSYDEAVESLKRIRHQQQFIEQHEVNPAYVRISEGGAPDWQLSLASELVVKSKRPDRFVHALKWLVIANLIRKESPISEKLQQISPAIEFLMYSMSEEDKEDAWQLAEEWWVERCEAFQKNSRISLVPELRKILEN